MQKFLSPQEITWHKFQPISLCWWMTWKHHQSKTCIKLTYVCGVHYFGKGNPVTPRDWHGWSVLPAEQNYQCYKLPASFYLLQVCKRKDSVLSYHWLSLALSTHYSATMHRLRLAFPSPLKTSQPFLRYWEYFAHDHVGIYTELLVFWKLLTKLTVYLIRKVSHLLYC